MRDRVIILIISILTTILTAHAQGAIFTDGTFTFRVIAEGECEIIGCQPPPNPLIIPSTTTNNGNIYVITSIGMDAFCDCKGLTGHLIIPNTVVSIGANAFTGIKFSGELVVPHSVKYIGRGAFQKTQFTKITLNASTATIYATTFKDCTSFETLILGDSIKSLGEWVQGPSDSYYDFPGGTFEGCYNLKNITFGENISTIGRATFKGCTGLSGKLVLPKSVKVIEDWAFSECKGLTGPLELPDNVTTIGSFAFSYCSNIIGPLELPNSVTYIGSSVFTSCTNINGHLKLPDAVATIQDYAFWGTNITGVTLPKSLQHLGHTPFPCDIISGILTLPASLISMRYSFENCTKITEVLFEPNSQIQSIIGAFKNCTQLNKVTISGNTKKYTVSGGAFAHCPNLTSVTLEGSICAINDTTFKASNNIRYLKLGNGDSQLKIDRDVFDICAIDTLHLGVTLTTDSWKFLNISTLKALTLGGSVNTVNDGDFAGCTGLKSLVLEYNGSLLPITLGSNGNGKAAFADCPIDSLHLGRTISADSHPDQFKDMTSLTKLTFGPSVLKIPESIFSGCSGISSLAIPKSVSTIGKNAFAGCTGIKTLRFEDGDNSNSYPYFNQHTVTIVMTDDGRSPFADSPIESLYVGVNLDYTVSPFKGSSTLRSVKFGEFVGKISDDCFDGCSALTDIEFPVIDRTAGYKNNRIIGRKAFANCTKLKGALSIPTVITAVEDSAFINCSGITKINIEGNKDAKTLPFGKGAFAGTPANTVSVSRNTTGSPFAGNASLNDLTIGEMVMALESDAFAGCTAISKVTSESATPPALQVSGFDTQTYDSAFLFVPDYTVTRYEAAQGWKNFTIFGKYEVLAKTVTISADKAELFAGSQMSLTAAVLPVNTRYKTITWKSSDESVATVDQSGNISAIKPGTATITASTVNRITASCTVTVLLVPVEATAIAFPEDNVELTQGESLQLTVLFTPEETTERELTWSCNNCDIATVDETGTVTALIPGTATVTATASNGLTASCTVTVLRRIIYAESISLDLTEAELTQGESVQLTATVSPDNTDDKTVIWSSSNEAVATVDATGLVSAISEGKATVTATTANGLTAACTVTVIPPVIEADGITLNITQTQIYTDGTLQLMATVSPDDTTDKTVKWSSGDEEIATVDATGLVSPISEGKTTITATTANGLTASCEVTVLKRIVIISPESITLNITQAGLTEGESVQLTATVSPEDADDKTVTWTSDNSAVATVDASGLVSAISEGMATITATTANGLTASCEVTVLKRIVIISPESIALNITQAELTEGESLQLTATV